MFSPHHHQYFLLIFNVVLSSNIVLTLTFLNNDRYYGSRQVTMLMPGVSPKTNESYLCSAFEIPGKEEWIVEFYPNTSVQVVHHIEAFGCTTPGYSEPGNDRAVWDCNGMRDDADPGSPYPKADICSDYGTIIYVYANGNKLIFPDKVGIKVGRSTLYRYVVVQVHYALVDPSHVDDRDFTGLTATLVPGYTRQITKHAHILHLFAKGILLANSIGYWEVACKINQSIVLHPISYHIHTHKLGKSVSGWRIRDGKWTLIGKENPINRQIFYPVKDTSLTLEQNDTLAVRCILNNYLPHPVYFGPTGDEEMCVVDLLTWYDDGPNFDQHACGSEGPPQYYWSQDPLIKTIPKFVDQQS